MARIIDISTRLHSGMPVWPGSTGLQLTRTESIERNGVVNVSKLACDVHTGTHVDAPLHYLPNGAAVEALPLEVLIGPAAVADLSDRATVTARDLERLSLPAGLKRLLLRTRNSDLRALECGEFQRDYAALSADAAQWIVANDILLVGVDYLSVQLYGDGPSAHQILLRTGVVIVEGLNLADVAPGSYQLVCLPLLLVGAEGAPARAVLLADGDFQPPHQTLRPNP